MKASPNKSSWYNLNGGTRLGIYLLLALPTGLFGIVVGYIIYLEATNSTVPVLSDFPPFIASLFIIGVSSIVVSIYNVNKERFIAFRRSRRTMDSGSSSHVNFPL